MDSLANFKSNQKEGWALFTPFESITVGSACSLVKFSQIQSGQKVLDVACGTGVASITAARLGAKVKGMDISPVLIERAKWNGQLAGLDVDFSVADAEELPYKDQEFDMVISQFGHMFAPNFEKTLSEMFRVLKPKGTVAFSTWPPEHFTGKMFSLTNKYDQPPEGVSAPSEWGDPKIVIGRLAGKATSIVFERDILWTPSLSPKHFRQFVQTHLGPVAKLTEKLKINPVELEKYQNELETLISLSLKDNVIRQHYLMTRGIKV